MKSFRWCLGAGVSAVVWLAGGASAPAAPAIQQAPQPITVTAGTTASFAVAATGTGTVHFDWRRDGASLGAPDRADYTSPATTLADSGAVFSVVVTDSSGSTPSASAFLTVNPVAPNPFAAWAASIPDAAQRGPDAMPHGDGVPNLIRYTLGLAPNAAAASGAFPVLATSSGDGGWVFRYTRDRRATGIAAIVERSTTLVGASWTSVPAAKVGDDGVAETWEAPVNADGAREFLRLSVSIKSNVVPEISAQPAGATVDAGRSPTFNVTATGTGPFTYQWRKNGVSIAGATGASYTPPPLTVADNGARFTVLVTGEAGTVASGEAVAVVRAVSSIAALVDQVSLSRYTVNLRDRLFTHLGDNRGLLSGAPSPQLIAARDMLIQHFKTCGFTVTTQAFASGGPTRTNVIATKLGTVRPNELVIVGAHYDSVGNPGANDNGSGTAAIMEAAQVLGARSYEATLRIIAFDNEEGGLVGSSAYVAAHPSDNVRCMLNVDTIAQDGGDHKLCIDSANHLAMENQVAAAMDRYGQGIVMVIRQTADMSDHLSFENAGFTACEVYNNDWWDHGDPNIHQPTDSVDTAGYINYAFATKVTRGVVGFLAEQAVLVGE